jgi:predicted lipoprotein with Yx(FWY)xxD motif
MVISRQWLAATGMSALALVAGCSSSGGSSSASPPASGGGTTVAVQSVAGSKVLVDGSGRTLYFSDQERAAHKVLCMSDSCQSIWVPLTLAAGQQPSGPNGISAELGTIAASGGGRQVTFNGAPLYTFSLDRGPGQMNGNGQHDSFDGTDFSWRAATVAGTPAAPAPSSNPYGNGGYGGGGGYGGNY